MTKRVRSAVAGMLFLVLAAAVLAVPQVVRAVTPSAGVHVYDGADLFSQSEENRLEEYLEQMGEEAGAGIYVLTSDGSGNGTSDKYIEDFYDAGHNRGTIEEDAVILHIDIEERYVNIQAYGRAEKKITDSKSDQVLDYIFDDLRQGRYYEACRAYAKRVEHYMNDVPFYLAAWFHLAAALIAGAISVSVMAASSGGKMTANAATYTDRAHTGIRARRDEYIRTSVTRRKKPETNGGGRRGGGHVSSGGHSHSSAGRHF